MALAPGTRLGPYEIVSPLGAGGMGEVYRAKDTRLGREVAVKVLPQHLSSSAEIRARFERDFFLSSEYRQLVQLSATLDSDAEELLIVRESRNIPAKTLRGVMEQLLEDVKRGLTTQRYKGLGEMNPDQLWETTMNSETRNMMQVKVEDAVAADEIFATLMGDEVEPRRAFIERHALSVTNLDT